MLTLLSYLNDQFSSSVVDQLAGQLDETPANMRKAVSGALAAVLGGLANRLQNGGAAALKAALGEAGIEETRVVAQSFGSTKPININETEAGRQQNRRINVVVTRLQV